MIRDYCERNGAIIPERHQHSQGAKLREFPTPEQIYTAIFDLPFAFSLRDEVAWPSRLPVHPRMRGERIADRIGDTTAQRELIVAQSTGMRRDCLFKA